MSKTLRRNLIEMLSLYSLILLIVGVAIRPLILETPDFYWPFSIFSLSGYGAAYYLIKNDMLGNHSSMVFFATTFACISPLVAISGGIYSHLIYLLPMLPLFAGLFISELGGWFAATLASLMVVVFGTCFLPEGIPIFSGDSIAKMVWLTLTSYIGVAVARFFARENRLLTETLEKQANMDYLTLVPNRRGIEKILSRELGFSKNFGQSLAVMMIDLDHFKVFNDQNGHMSGDLWLTEVGKYLEEIVTLSGGYLGRYGGEEFIAVVPSLGQHETQTLAESMCQAVRSMQIPLRRGETDLLTVSIGVSYCPAGGNTTESDLIARADAELYKAKESGRDRVHIDFSSPKSAQESAVLL